MREWQAYSIEEVANCMETNMMEITKLREKEGRSKNGVV